MKYQIWFRMNDEKDYYEAEFNTDSEGMALELAREKDRRVFKAYKV